MMQEDVNMIWSKNKNNTNSKGMVTMNFYDDLVMQTQMNYSKYYHIYASGSTPYQPVSYTHLDVYKRQTYSFNWVYSPNRNSIKKEFW